MQPLLVIFDCDGVLVDSEAIANDTLAEAVTALGLPMTGAETRRLFVGLSFRTVCDHLQHEYGLVLPDGWGQEIEARDFAAFRVRLQPVPHVKEIVAIIGAHGIARCVASSGSFAKMDVTLNVTGLAPLFAPHIFSASQVAAGKPAPDLFLFAAERMGVHPRDVIVIEDSVYGVMAARHAGMRVLGYCGDPMTDRALLESEGAEIFSDMREVPARLAIA